MAFVHGKGAYISVGGTNLTPYSNEVSMPRDIETADTSHFGTQSKTYITGMDDSNGSVSGLYDSVADAAIQALLTQLLSGAVLSVPVVYGPAGNATGRPSYTYDAIINSYEVSASAGDVVSFSLGLQRTGSTTVGTFV